MPREPITSRTNPWFKRFRLAIDRHDEEIVIEGPKQVADAIAAGWEPIAIAGAAEIGTIQPLEFSSTLIKALSETIHHQGVLGLFHRPSLALRDAFRNDRTIVVALDGVQDPGNVGTIIRLAAAFDAGGVILTGESADPFAPKSIRASAGAILVLPVIAASRSALLEEAAANGFTLYAAASGEGRLEVPTSAAVILFGSEGRGVSPALLDAAKRISIRTSPTIESLNVATAAAIVLQRSYEGRGGGSR